jgi:hypothetical protein
MVGVADGNNVGVDVLTMGMVVGSGVTLAAGAQLDRKMNKSNAVRMRRWLILYVPNLDLNLSALISFIAKGTLRTE